MSCGPGAGGLAGAARVEARHPVVAREIGDQAGEHARVVVNERRQDDQRSLALLLPVDFDAVRPVQGGHAAQYPPSNRPPPLLEWSAVCGRFTNTQRKSDEIQQKLAAKLGIEQPEDDRGYERFNIAPTQEVLAVVDDEDGRRMEPLRWGLVPRWAKDLKVGYKMINARAETIERAARLPRPRPARRSIAA